MSPSVIQGPRRVQCAKARKNLTRQPRGIVQESHFQGPGISDEQWRRIEPHLPTDVRGVERVDDRRVISGIVHVLKSGCRWCDCPPDYGPPTTIYNRFRAGRGAASGKTYSLVVGFLEGRPWLAGRRIGEASLDVGSSRISWSAAVMPCW